MNKLSTMLFQVVTVEQWCNNMLTILFIVGRTTLFTPVDINLEQVVDFLNFYACKMMHAVASKRRLINVISLSFVSKLFSKKFFIGPKIKYVGFRFPDPT